MAITLYDATVRLFLQTLEGAEGFLAKGLAHMREVGLDPENVVETRLIETMQPFRFQARCIVHHTRGAVEAVESGVFSFSGVEANTYAELQAAITEARVMLAALDPDAVNAWEGRDVVFNLRTGPLPFKAEGFLTSFSLPNLHFHATTAYDIIRMTGAPIGKLDYMGPMQLVAAQGEPA